jgi:HPt (histidine-containing phosphotransfer) domain-containing protein
MENNFQQIRTEQLESISSGDKSFEKELIEIFLEQIPSFILNIKSFFEKNDLINLAKEAHTAKSSALIFGLTNTGNSLKEIQLQAEEKKVEKLAALIESVEIELKDAEKQLQKILGDSNV